MVVNLPRSGLTGGLPDFFSRPHCNKIILLHPTPDKRVPMRRMRNMYSYLSLLISINQSISSILWVHLHKT